MTIIKMASEAAKQLDDYRKQGLTIGFVPTMGALHEGHISLIKRATQENDLVICSIFINPTQFNNTKDFDKYPVTTEKDIQLLKDAGCHILFIPTVAEIYPKGVETSIFYELGYLETILEGKYRPGHFQGVCQVVQRLLEIVEPNQLYIGQKDFQQCMVLKKLVELMRKDIRIIICPTKRETDGLAMSSRNMRLDPEQRVKAAQIFQTLLLIKEEIKEGDLHKLKEKATHFLSVQGFKVDYIEIADAETLELTNSWNGETKLVALIAAFLGEIRLIDNMLL